MRTRPEVLHLDLDAFFAAVEQRDKPATAGKPVIVGGLGHRGVVATASYEARAFGVSSAMPTAQARRLCPHGAFLAGRFAAYRAASNLVMDLVRRLSPLVEQVSIDEAYIDLGPTDLGGDEAAVAAVAEQLRADIRSATGLAASIGAGTSKLVAKVASDLAKPDGLLVVPAGDEQVTLAPLPVRRLPCVGPATEERLRLRRIRSVGELAQVGQDELVEMFGVAHGGALYRSARGLDDRMVVPERDAKSVSAEETFAADLTDRRLLNDQLRRLVDRVTGRLVREQVSGRTVTVKVRRYDFTTVTRSVTLPHATDAARPVLAAASGLLAGVDVSDGVRLLGVGVSGLTAYNQPSLLEDLTDDATDDARGAGLEAHATPDPLQGPGETRVGPPVWVPGQDVTHVQFGPGWVQGSGVGRVTVRFEGPHTDRGPVRTFPIDDPDLAPSDPPVW